MPPPAPVATSSLLASSPALPAGPCCTSQLHPDPLQPCPASLWPSCWASPSPSQPPTRGEYAKGIQQPRGHACLRPCAPAAAAANAQRSSPDRTMLASTPPCSDGTAYSGDGEKDETGFNACGFGSIGDHWCVGWRLAGWVRPGRRDALTRGWSPPAGAHACPLLISCSHPLCVILHPTLALQGEVLLRRALGHV